MKGLVLTYVLAVLSGVSALRYPAIGVIAYIGFGILRPRFLFGWAGPITDISFWVGVATIIGWSINGFGSWRLGRAAPIMLALGVFVAWTIVSAVFALDTARSYFFLYTLGELLLPVVIGVSVLNDPKWLRWTFWTIVLAQAYVGFEMNLAYLRGFNIAAEGFGGMDNNFFGASLVSTIGPALALGLAAKTWKERALAYGAAALIFHTTLLTFSRGAMVGMIAMAIVGFIMIPKSPRFLVACLVVTLVAVRFTGPQLLARYSTVFVAEEERDSSAESRIELWRDCIAVIEEYPIFGVGPGNWRVIANSYGWSQGKSAHSVWMETAAENGLPAVLALLAFFGLTAMRLWPLARAKVTDENRYEVAMATGVVLSVVGFSVAGQFVSAPALEPPYYVVLVGMCLLKIRVPHPTGRTVTARAPHPSLSPFAPAVRIPATTAPGVQAPARRQA